MPDLAPPDTLQAALVALCDAPLLADLPPHYRLALAQFATVYHLACKEGRHQRLLDVLRGIRRVRTWGGGPAPAWGGLDGRAN
jgi:hypothetical protein